MRLSESLQRNIMETAVGSILNKFKVKKRRVVLFFEDISANYVKMCENAGYSEKVHSIGQKWGFMCTKTLVPSSLNLLSPILFLNKIVKRVWVNIGLMDDFKVTKKDDIIKLEIRNDAITRIIGKNNFAIGCFSGILNALFKSKIYCVKASQSKNLSKYVFKTTTEPVNFDFKTKKKYEKLNTLPSLKGFTLKDSIRNGLFQIKKNKIYFRKKIICNSENTIFHLFSNYNILLDKISEISYNYFNDIIEKESSVDSKLNLLKTLLQTMGWGILTIIRKEKEIIIEIKNPPYGFQKEKDDWSFLIRVIEGYLWTINRNFRINDIKENFKYLRIIYSL